MSSTNASNFLTIELVYSWIPHYDAVSRRKMTIRGSMDTQLSSALSIFLVKNTALHLGDANDQSLRRRFKGLGHYKLRLSFQTDK